MQIPAPINKQSTNISQQHKITAQSSQPSTDMSTYIALASPSNLTTLHIHRLAHASSITSLPRDLHSHSIASLSFPDGTRILDAKFADDGSLLSLIHISSSRPDKKELQGYRILSIPYNDTSARESRTLPIKYSAIPSANCKEHLLPTGTAPPASLREPTQLSPTQVQGLTRHVFETEARFTPSTFVVNGRKARRVLVVLAEDRKHYRILDMDYPSQRDEEKDATDAELGEDGDTVMSGL